MQPQTIGRVQTDDNLSKVHQNGTEHSLNASGITHEVRNPLTNIILAVEMLQLLVTSDAQRSYLDIIMRASQRINILVTALAGKQQEEEEEEEEEERIHSLHQLLDEVLTMADDRLRLKNIKVIKEYLKKDHSMSEKRVEMKIALTNIIINAIDAMKEQDGVLKLVTTAIDGNYTLVIEDNGCGIPAADMEHIFQPFFTRKTGGLGIGLATTSNILKGNNVKIAVESEEGRGTKFILSFTKASPIL